MNKKMYLRGLAGQIFYNSTEILALALTYRPIPKTIEYVKNVRYGKEKNNYMFNYFLKDIALQRPYRDTDGDVKIKEFKEALERSNVKRKARKSPSLSIYTAAAGFQVL